MKRIVKIAALLLVAVLALSFGACESNADKLEKLVGTYTQTYVYEESEVEEHLRDSLEAYDEEIALADLGSYKEIYYVTFEADGSYEFNMNVEATIDCVRDFYDGYFTALYEGRTTLNEVYDYEFDALTEDEFKLMFAELYSFESYDELLDYFVDSDYYYSEYSEPYDFGTFRIRNGQIYCTENGASEEETLGYELEGDTLTLYFSDSTEVYTKAN